jgi:hypothetical protein
MSQMTLMTYDRDGERARSWRNCARRSSLSVGLGKARDACLDRGVKRSVLPLTRSRRLELCCAERSQKADMFYR